MVTGADLLANIRRDNRVEGLSLRELARRQHVYRRTFRVALGSAVKPARKVPVRGSARLDPLKPFIDEVLKEDLAAPRKQRHAARRRILGARLRRGQALVRCSQSASVNSLA